MKVIKVFIFVIVLFISLDVSYSAEVTISTVEGGSVEIPEKVMLKYN